MRSARVYGGSASSILGGGLQGYKPVLPIKTIHNRIAVGGVNVPSGYAVNAARWKAYQASTQFFGSGGAYVGPGPDHQTSLESLDTVTPLVFYGYENGPYTNSNDPTSWHSNTGVLYSTAEPAHPTWFLVNSSGVRISATSGSNVLWLMDIGNAGYRQEWCDRTIPLFQFFGAKGLFIDDAFLRIPSSGAGSPITYQVAGDQVATDRNWQAAYRGFLSYIRDRFNAAFPGTGFKIMLNISYAREYADTYKDFLQFCDVVMYESWARNSSTSNLADNGTGANGGPGPSGQYGSGAGWQHYPWAVQEACRQGKAVLAAVPCTDLTQAQQDGYLYGVCTALLGVTATGKLLIASTGNYSDEPPWFQPIADIIAQMGPPLGNMVFTVGGGGYRVFQHARVRVNPQSSTQTVDGVSMPALTAQLIAT